MLRVAVYGLVGVVAALSIRPARNMLSPSQMMNFSFNPLHLVNTYGAFGSITRTRYEIVLEGTDDRVDHAADRVAGIRVQGQARRSERGARHKSRRTTCGSTG